MFLFILVSFFSLNASRSRIILTLVSHGAIISSIIPKDAAKYGLLNLSSYAATSSALLPRVTGAKFPRGRDDVAGSLRAHHGDFRRRPRHNVIRAQLLGAHAQISAAVSLARDDR